MQIRWNKEHGDRAWPLDRDFEFTVLAVGGQPINLPVVWADDATGDFAFMVPSENPKYVVNAEHTAVVICQANMPIRIVLKERAAAA